MKEELCESAGIPGFVTRVYIKPRMISERYSDIICYGVRIEKVASETGGAETVASSAELDDVFFRYEDAAAFSEYAKRSGTGPYRLREAVERFTKERILRSVTA